MKEAIKKLALQIGVDDVGFASVSDYNSPKSPNIQDLFPQARSIVVLAFKELSSCESASPQIAMNGRLDVMEFSRSSNYKVARFIEREYGAKSMTVGVSYPQDMGSGPKGLIGEISMRHAAVAAGLGSFGRHNLVIHPRFGTRVVFTAVLSSLDLPSDPVIERDLCIHCDVCVQGCPGKALGEEGKTHAMRCLSKSQPYGLGTKMQFWSKFADNNPEEQKSMVRSEEFWKLYQAGFIGFQYHCFKCMAGCPVGQQLK